jgi:lipoate-protein ligase A
MCDSVPHFTRSAVPVTIRFMASPDHYSRATWRLIIHNLLDGPLNMAIDEAISEAVASDASPPTLRFYGWQPACLSLGYAQPVTDVDFGRLSQYGWDVVRRLTGGRAILHIDEWTYSVATMLNDPRVDGGVVESYRRISRALVAGLEQLAVPVHTEKAAKGAHGFSGAVCFEMPSDYEVTAHGKNF